MERPWLALPIVLVRFIAEGGCGMPELKLSPPKVCLRDQHHAATIVGLLGPWGTAPPSVFGRSKDRCLATSCQGGGVFSSRPDSRFREKLRAMFALEEF